MVALKCSFVSPLTNLLRFSTDAVFPDHYMFLQHFRSSKNRYRSLVVTLNCSCGVQKKYSMFHYKKSYMPCCTSISCFLQNLVENLGSWLLDVILLSLLPSAYVSTFQLNLYLNKPCQILQSDLFPSVHLCCSSAAGEAHFPPGVETQGWSLLKRTSRAVGTLGTEEFVLVLSAHQGCCCLLGLGPGVEIHWLGVGFL